MKKVAIFTIASCNYLHYAKTLAQSLKEHEGSADRYLFLVDTPRPETSTDELSEFDAIVPLDTLPLSNKNRLKFQYDVMELNTAIKPTAFLYLLEQGYDRVIYFDPDIVLYRPIDDVHRALDDGYSTVLTPHGTRGNLHRVPPNDHTFLQAGVYNLGFMALADTKDVRRSLVWWASRLEDECVANRLSDGLFVDQKFVDLWPAYCGDTYVLRHEGYNVAYWNLDHRPLDGDVGNVTAGGFPLVFFHFSGVVPSNRRILSKHQQRWTPDSSPTIKGLLNDYIDRLERNGRQRFEPLPYGFGFFEDGTIIPGVVRWLYREQMAGYVTDPFKMVDPFVRATAPIVPNPRGAVTAVAYRLWRSREDLHSAYDLGSGASQLAYAGWFASMGADQWGIPGCFSAEVRRRLDGANGISQGLAPSARLARNAYKRLLDLAPKLRPFYKYLPRSMRGNVLKRLFAWGWPASSAGVRPLSAEHLRPGVALVGYPFAEMGVGEALRALARTTSAASIETDVYNFDAHVAGRQNDSSISALVTNTLVHRTNVFCVNADMLGPTLQAMGADATKGRYNVIRPFWELPDLHPDWLRSLQAMDEVWAPTRFVQRAFQKAVDRPVTYIPVAVDLPEGVTSKRAAFGLRERAFLFLFSFDMASYATRKNPAAVIAAFQRAFPDFDESVGLVVKTMGNGAAREENAKVLGEAARRDARIKVIDATLDRLDALCLTASCDVFVSLHRSEGFGLGIAEAMAMGKGAVATDYSGSTDFLTGNVGYPIPYELIDVGPTDYAHFIEGQQWADPDVSFAAQTMRSLAADPGAVIEKGRRAADYMRQFHSSTAVAKHVARRLSEIWAEK